MSHKLAEILKDFRLPICITNDEGEEFGLYVTNYFDAYLKSLNTLSTPVIVNANSKSGIITEVEQDEIKFVCLGLGTILETYLEGYTANAFHLFEKMIEDIGIGKDLLRLNVIKLNKQTPFFRTQKNHSSLVPDDNNYQWSRVSPSELFHAPFNKRKRVGTNRFSIPGYPCLYVSQNLNTSYHECTQLSSSSLNAICLRNNRPLYVADITPISEALLEKAINLDDYGLTGRINIYAKLFPIIAACHCKIKYKEDYDNEVNFRVEYVIPQLLLQWFQKHGVLFIDGIRI